MALRLRHPGSAGNRASALRQAGFRLLDDLRRPLVPATYLHRLKLRWNGTVVADLTNLPAPGTGWTSRSPACFWSRATGLASR